MHRRRQTRWIDPHRHEPWHLRTKPPSTSGAATPSTARRPLGVAARPKRLEQGRFTWLPIRDGAVYLTTTQLSMLVDGLDWSCVAPKAVKHPVRAI
jgi:transposase